MKKVILYSIALLAISACKKKDDFSGDGRFSGLLSYYNPNSGEVISKPLANRKVYLAYSPSDTLNYIYSTTTNNDGYFVFTNADKQRQYDIFFTDTIGAVWYRAILPVSADKDTLQLLAVPDTTRQNAIAIEAQDSTGGRIQEVSIAGYDNHDIYLADSAAKTDAGAVFKFTTNQYGINTQYNIKASTYYLVGRKQVGTLSLAGYSKKYVSTFGIFNAAITMIPVVPKYGLKITATDAGGNAMENVEVNIYGNYDIFAADSAGNTTTVAGVVKTITTNANGFITWFDSPPAMYHIIAKRQLGSLSFVGYQHVQTADTSIKTTGVTLLPVTPNNGMKITVRDSVSNPIYNADVFVYTSSVVAALDSPTRAVATYSFTTTTMGTGQTINIPAATYYIRARKSVGGITLFGSKTVIVPVSGIADSSLFVH